MDTGLFWENVEHGVPLLQCRLLPVRHGFARRSGGVSVIPHLASLNVGGNLGDDPSFVAENRRRLSRAIGATPERMVGASQIHSDRVETVTEHDAGRCDYSCDGFVTACPDLALLIKTADCAPILLCDPKNGVIAALHAGWRGAVAQIASRGVDAMCALGAQREEIRAAVGPCIHACCYEVGEDVICAVQTLCGKDAQTVLHAHHGRPANASDGKMYLDLSELNRYVLLHAGLNPAHVAVSEICTCCNPERYFSHRGANGKRGVMGAVIAL